MAKITRPKPKNNKKLWKIVLLSAVLATIGLIFIGKLSRLDTEGLFGRVKQIARKQAETTPTENLPGYLIIHTDNISATTFDDFKKYKSDRYAMQSTTFQDIKNWCDRNLNQCDQTEVPVWAGGSAYKVAEDRIHAFCREKNLISKNDPSQICVDEWPSILRSYLYHHKKNLKFVLFAGALENFPFVVISESAIPTFLYYSDLNEDPIKKNTLHTWNRNGDKILAQLYYTDPNNPTVRNQIINDYFREDYPNHLKCPSLEQSGCDDTDISLYLPTINIGVLPFKDEAVIKSFLSSASQPAQNKNFLTIAASAFVNHDNWFLGESASAIWNKTGKAYQSTQIYGEGGLEGTTGLVPYPRPNCGFLPWDRAKCWFGNKQKTPFSWALFNSHGGPDSVSGIIHSSEILNKDLFKSEKTTSYVSVACSNLALATSSSISSKTTYLPAEIFHDATSNLANFIQINQNIDFLGDPEIPLDEQIALSFWKINQYSSKENQTIEFKTEVSSPNAAAMLYRAPLDQYPGDDLILADPYYLSLISSKDGNFTTTMTATNPLSQNIEARNIKNLKDIIASGNNESTKQKLETINKFVDVKGNLYPEIISIEKDSETHELKKVLLYEFSPNIFADQKGKSTELQIPTKSPEYIHQIKLSENKKHILISSSNVEDPLTLIEFADNDQINIFDIRNPSYKWLNSSIGEDILNEDLNNDSKPDVLLGNFGNYFISFTNPSGSFGDWQEIPDLSGRDPISIDLNNDAKKDLITKIYSSTFFTFLSDKNTWVRDKNIDLDSSSTEPEQASARDLTIEHVTAYDVNQDGQNDLVATARNGIGISTNLGNGMFSQWNFISAENKQLDLPDPLFDNIGYRLMRYGNGKAFLGGIDTVLSSGRAAKIAQDQFTKHFADGNEIGLAVNYTLQDFVNQCTGGNYTCGLGNYADQIKDVFIFLLYGDPTINIPKN